MTGLCVGMSHARSHLHVQSVQTPNGNKAIKHLVAPGGVRQKHSPPILGLPHTDIARTLTGRLCLLCLRPSCCRGPAGDDAQGQGRLGARGGNRRRQHNAAEGPRQGQVRGLAGERAVHLVVALSKGKDANRRWHPAISCGPFHVGAWRLAKAMPAGSCRQGPAPHLETAALASLVSTAHMRFRPPSRLRCTITGSSRSR